MKVNWKQYAPEKSRQILCKCEYEEDIFYVVGFFNGIEIINPETKKPIRYVVGWDYIE